MISNFFKKVSPLKKNIVQIATPIFYFSQNFHKIRNPYDNSIVSEILFKTEKQANDIINKAKKIQESLQFSPLQQRIDAVKQAIKYFQDNKEYVARLITMQMGKTITESRAEIATMISRVEHLIQIAPDVLTPEIIKQSEQGCLKIKHEPVGVVLLISPWNYPLLTAAGPLVTAILAGNTVVIKHSSSTPLIGQVFQDAFKESNLVFDCFTDRKLASQLILNKQIGYVSFTGSVAGGRSVFQQTSNSLNGLELGGKDGFYVADDILSMEKTVASLMDGVFYNCGQGCCSIERIYVNKKIYKEFLEETKKFENFFILGDPLNEQTTMGPMCLQDAPKFIENQVKQALLEGGKLLFGGKTTQDKSGKGRFFQPTVVYDTNQKSSLMQDESFGPVVGITQVQNDEEGLKMVNDSQFGLTGGIFTNSIERADWFGDRLQAGTAYMNRSDFLHPLLPWSGRKDTGKGVSLSKYGFYQVTQTKAYNYNFKL